LVEAGWDGGASWVFLLSAFSVVRTLSIQVIFAVVGTGVVEICSVNYVDFAPDGFKAECCMREGVGLEGDGFGRLYWDSGSFRSGCRVGCEPSIGRCHCLVNAAAFDHGSARGRGRRRGKRRSDRHGIDVEMEAT
jgi:hypothetical protein